MAVAQFTREYTLVRRAEGWGSPDSAYYRALPYADLTGRFSEIWRIRARSYDTFVERVLVPLEARMPRRLTILDLGAGNGWLAYRLALRGHAVIAVDLIDDPFDGLGARRHYDADFAAIVGEFDKLPLQPRTADMAIFNASLHYSTDYLATLREARRVVGEAGTLVILDSPMYSDPSSGRRMVKEREARFVARYGFASDALPSEHFLTPRRLDEVGATLGLQWIAHRPTLDWSTRITRRIGGIRARREPATFPLIVGCVR
jgi:SAM-dependent methyltransferase